MLNATTPQLSPELAYAYACPPTHAWLNHLEENPKRPLEEKVTFPCDAPPVIPIHALPTSMRKPSSNQIWAAIASGKQTHLRLCAKPTLLVHI